MPAAFIRSLEEPRDVSTRWSRTFGLGMSTFSLAYVGLLFLDRDVMVGLSLVATAHAVAMAFLYLLLAFLFLNQAQSRGAAGYLALGGAFALAGLVWGLYPYFFPNGLAYTVPARAVFGDDDSAAALYMVNRWTISIGMLSAAWLLRRQWQVPMTRRRASLAVTLGIASVVVVLTLLWAGLGAPGFPPLIDSDGRASTTAIAIAVTALLFNLVALVALLRYARSGAFIMRWLLALAVLQLLESVSVPLAPRYSANWLQVRSVSLVGSLILLFVLLAEIMRILQASRQAAEVDELTGGPLRAAYVRMVTQHLSGPAQSRQGSGLLWVDLDQFRLVNSSAGNVAGDAFLQAVAERLRNFVPGGELPARIGGDEFALIMRARRPEDLLDRAQQVVEVVGRPFEVADARVVCTASIGCAWIDPELDSAEEALRRAFAAAQAAKEAGGDTARLYSPVLDASTEEEARLRHRLAVALRDELFDHHYQPILDTRSGRVVGVEALIRLADAYPPVSAGLFIRTAEASGQIIAIGRFGLQRLVQDLPKLLGADPSGALRVSFNLSVLQLADPESMAMLLKAPLRTHAPRLVIEVTESVEFAPASVAHENLMRLVRAGYGVAIDDFGSGFSNFTELEEIGRHMIKLDRSLIVRAATREPSSLAVLSAALAVAQSLATEILAEGVETEAEAAIVEEMGIYLVQGYRYAKPMPLADTVAFIQLRGHHD